MTLLQLLKKCKDNNIALSVDEDKLIIKAPDGSLTPELRSALKAAKAELLAMLSSTSPEKQQEAGQTDSPDEPMPLSPYQMPFWDASDGSSERVMLNIVEAFDFEFRVELPALQKAVEWTINRHEMLRVAFSVDESGIVNQHVQDDAPVQIDNHTILTDSRQEESKKEHDQVVLTLVDKFTSTRPPVKQAPLRVGLVNSSAGGSTVVLSIPHVVGDAASLEVILNDLMTFFDCQKNDLSLPDSRPYQYSDYLRWLNEQGRNTLSTERHLGYWQDQLQNLPPVLGLPSDFTRPTDSPERPFGMVMFTLPFSEKLRANLQEKGISPFVYLHTALRIAMYRFSGCSTVPAISPMANRHNLPVPNATVGCFANEVALNIPLSEGESIADALQQTRNHLAGALDHQSFPFTHVIEAMRGPRTQDWLPIAQIFFSYLELASDLPVKHRFDHVSGVKYDLSFIIADCKEHKKLMLGYDKTLFKKDTILRLGELFVRVCETMHSQLQSSPSSLVLTDTEESTGQGLNGEQLLKQRLTLQPDEAVCFIDTSKTPALSRLETMLANIGVGSTAISPEQISAQPGKTLLVTSRHPGLLTPLLEKVDRSRVRLCIVNNLPSAMQLKSIGDWDVKGMFLLELPDTPDQLHNTLSFATFSFEECGRLEGNERYIPCTVEPLSCTAVAGEQLNLGNGLYAHYLGANILRLPLPHTAISYVWHSGLALNLNSLANEWATRSGGHPVALSLAPSPVDSSEPDHLTAWIPSSSQRNVEQTSFKDIHPQLPSHWPDYHVAISAIPLTKSGEVDRNALEHIPMLAPELLPRLEDTYLSEHLSPVALQLESKAAKTACVHYSQVIPESNALSIEGDYTALGLSTAEADDTSLSPSIAYGPDFEQEPNISFREHMERFQAHELVFIDINGTETCYSGEEFLNRARNLLSAMQHHGLKAGDKVIVYCAEEQELYALAWACLLGGICMAGLLPPVAGQSPQPIHTRLGHIHTILGEPVVITTRGENLPLEAVKSLTFQDLLEQGESLTTPPAYHTTEPDTLVYTAFTSGSTGAPKAVPLTASNVFAMIYAKMQTIGSIENETAFSMTALDHVASLFCNSIYSTVCGARQVYCSFQYILAAPERILDIVDKFRVSHTWAPDFTWRQLYETLKNNTFSREWDLTCLRHIISAAENTREATFRNLEQALRPYGMPPRVLLHSWGMSETSSLLTMSDYWDEASHESYKGIIDAGRPMAGSAFRVADRNGVPVPEGSIGSFQVKGRSVLSGYYNNPKANAESFTKDGWFITGDLAMLQNGKVVFCGREKEQIVIKGQNIAQFDIEGFVDGIEGVVPTFSVVIGCKNEKTEDDAILVFAHTEHTSPEKRAAVIRKINATLASHFGVVPAQVLLVEKEDVPKALLGKIQRTNILKRFLKGEFKEQVREADILLANTKTFPDWFASKTWAKANVPCKAVLSSNGVKKQQHIIITGSDTELGDALHKKLILQDMETLHIPSASTDDIRQHISEQGQPPTIVYLLDKEPHLTDTPAHTEWQRDAFAPLFSVLKDIAEQRLRNCNIVVVTKGGQAQDNTTFQKTWSAAAGGMTSSLARSASEKVTLLDLEGRSAATDADAIFKELISGDASSWVKWRGEDRFVPVLHPTTISSDATNQNWTQAVGSDNFCLCTGITGRLGRDLLPQLLRLTTGNFLVIGRKSADEVYSLLEEQCSTVLDWKKRTHYVQASLDDTQDIQAAIDMGASYFSSQYEKKILPGGILHLAADTAEQGFSDVSQNALLQGLQNRLNHLKNLEHAFISSGGTGPRIAFSSVLSFWGGADSALYAPACALTEAYVYNHRLMAPSLNDTWHCFMWSRWRDSSLQDDLIARLMEERGFLTLDAERGALSLLAMLHHSANVNGETLIAGLNLENPHIHNYMRYPGHKTFASKVLAAHIPQTTRSNILRSFLRKHVGRQVQIQISEVTRVQYDDQGRLIPDSQKQNMEANADSPVLQRMAAIWKEVLNASHIDPTASFFELGGTSVQVPRLRQKVLDEFEIDLGSVGIFDYPTICEMAKAVQHSGKASNTQEVASSRAQKQRAARRVRR